MKLDVIKLDGGKGGSIELADDIFGIEEIRADILQRCVTWQLAKRRSGNHKIQVRNEVSRTGKKMYKQKGTGGARHGSRRAAQFVGGAKAHGPVVRSHAFDLPKKVRALALRHALSSKARTGALVGTPEYMAPEVLRGQEADARADVWSLCVTLFEAVAGISPFRRSDFVATVRAVVDDAPASWPTSLDGDLRTVLARGLAKRMAGTGVTVNSVLPGPTLSEGVEAMLEAERAKSGKSIEQVAADFVKQHRSSSIIQRAASVEEVANMVVYLASPLASATTGAALRVDGGVIDTLM